jgi:hypothetical protein
MKRAAAVIGVALILVGIGLLLQGMHMLPGGLLVRGKWGGLGWGAWALAFGAGFLVWSNNAGSKT